MPEHKIDIGVLQHLDFDTQRAFEQLRTNLEASLNKTQAIEDWIATQPPILTVEEISQQLGPLGQAPVPTAGLLNTTPADTNTPDIPPVDDGIPNYLDIVTAAHDARSIGPTSTNEEVYNFMRQVAEDINNSGTVPAGLTCGFCEAPVAGDNVFTCGGVTSRYNRVCFSNGHIFKILIDSDPGGTREPTWADNGLDPSLYQIATAPDSPC